MIDAQSDNSESSVSIEETIESAWADITSRDNPDDKEPASVDEQPLETDGNTLDAAPEEQVKDEKGDIPAEPLYKAPSTWKKDMQEKFNTLPPDVQAEINRRESDIHRGLEQYKSMAERGNSYERAITPFKDTIQKIGMTPEQAISGLMQTDHTLRHGSPAQKVAMLQTIIQTYGINPEWFDQQNTQHANPEIGHLQNRLQQFESLQAQQQQVLQNQEVAKLNSDIAAFASKNEHFEAVKYRMADLLQGGAAKTLQEAYDTAIWADPTTRATLLAKQQADARAKAAQKAAEAKKLSSANVRTRGVVPAQEAVGAIEDTIRAEAKRLGLF